MNIFGYKKLLLILMACLMPLAIQAQSMDDDEDLEKDFDEEVTDSIIMLDVISDLEDMWGGSTLDRLELASKEISKIGNRTGIYVYDLEVDSVVYSYKANVGYKPASNEKLLTSIAALSTLGKDYTFSTPVYYSGQICNTSDTTRMLDGDIYVVGGFDPMLSFDDARAIADHIKALGINRISGYIYADVHQKDALLKKAHTTYERIQAGDSELFITPLAMNRGRISTEMPDNKSKSGTRVKHPETYFTRAIYELLREDGMEFDKRTPYGRSNIDSLKVTKIWSIDRPIADVLDRMMKKSDNYYAECMMLQLGHNCNNPCEWNYSNCVQTVKRVMGESGADLSTLIINDGSGLSHGNRVTPESVTRLLIYAYRNPNIYEPLFESLPIAGVDGTLKSRMKDSKAEDNVRAKTGTISGVSTLSGYLKAANGHMLAFSIMNNNLRSPALGRAFQNKICKLLAR